MPRRRKALVDLVRDGTFLARKDEYLLARSEELLWPELERLRSAFRVAEPDDRRGVALELERGLREHPASHFLGDLQAELRKLGPPGSFEQLEAFFPWAFQHYAGARAGERFHLDPFQAEFLREFWRRRPDGRRVYQVGLWGMPKGCGKTPIASGLGTHAVVSETDAPEVYSIAGAKDQAAICHGFARDNIEDGRLAAWLDAGSTIHCPEHRGEYTVQSSDGDLGHGVNPSAAIVDEWWLFQHRKHRESYNALAKALHKRSGRSWLLAISTAGFDMSSQLGETYEAAMKHPGLEVLDDGFLRVVRDEEAGFLCWWYGVPDELAGEVDIEDPAVIRACNPAPWVDPRDLIAELHRADTDELDWRRLHLNQWTKAKFSWLSSGVWRGLRSDAQIPEGAGIHVAVDAAYSFDTTAVAWAWRNPETGRVVLRAHVWSVRDDAPAHAHVPGGRLINELLVEPFIHELARHYRVIDIAFDPRLFAAESEHLGRDGFVIFPIHPQSREMADAVTEFYKQALLGGFTHDGDEVLAQHVDATAGVKNPTGGWRIYKAQHARPIDAAVASCPAVWRAMTADAGTWEGPVVV